ncbi:MAG: DUF2007 domain-containing protein [Bacteroidota bacterium]
MIIYNMDQDWTEVFRTSHEYRAVLARDILENHGLKVVIMNQQGRSYLTFGTIAVMVPESDKDQAINLLSDFKP